MDGFDGEVQDEKYVICQTSDALEVEKNEKKEEENNKLNDFKTILKCADFDHRNQPAKDDKVEYAMKDMNNVNVFLYEKPHRVVTQE